MHGPVHDFWLLREGERRYEEYWDLLGRDDAPVRFPDDPLRYLEDTLSWVPTIIPSLPELPAGEGLNWSSPTIINHTGGALFGHVCMSWARLFSRGPERLTLRGLYGWQWPFDEVEHTIHFDQLVELGDYDRLEIDRTWLVETLNTLARFGEQAGSGQFYILHLGI